MGIARACSATLTTLAILALSTGPAWNPATALADEEAQAISLTPTRVATVSQDRCGAPTLSTAGTNCVAFDGREVRSQPDLFVVGFENDQDQNEKHVLQAASVYDLSGLPAGAKVTKASLGYSEASTMRRSAQGESQYGILPTCNTKLGVVDAWDGNQDTLLKPKSAAVAGVAGATTGDAGSWDVTPQVKQWVDASGKQGTFVMSGDDESMDPKAQTACLSYVIDLGLSVEYTTQDDGS
jgi:hypothetical protein